MLYLKEEVWPRPGMARAARCLMEGVEGGSRDYRDVRSGDSLHWWAGKSPALAITTVIAKKYV